MVVSYLLILCQRDTVVAHKQLYIRLSECVIGTLDARLTDSIDVNEHRNNHCCHCNAGIHDGLRVLLHSLAKSGEGVVHLVN